MSKPTADEILNLENRICKLELRIEDMGHNLEWMRKRLGVLLPERTHCRFCKAIVHKDAKACGSCGKSWGAQEDPRKGLPR